jgi:predicted ATP-grasp superfamily ATP-dependent carboligase
MYGKNRLLARLSHAANSLLVDKRYYVPSPVEDWRTGRIQRENTEREEAYIQAVERICEREKIDTIFPCFDPQVYVFSKNKERFEKIGVLLPIPDYGTVITPLDKYRTIQAAQAIGFPCPKTYLPESEDDLSRIAGEVGFPAVLKPRFTSASRGMAIVRDLPELLEKLRLIRNSQGVPMVQEYIPGRDKPNFNLLLDKKGELKVCFYRRTLRYFFKINLNIPTATESMAPPSDVMHVVHLVQELGWWGSVTVETKTDPRDGFLKLMEINPRLGYGLWRRTELGINEPLMCLKIARGEETEPVKDYSVGTIILDPIEDMLGLVFSLLDLVVYKSCKGLLRMKPLIDPLDQPTPLKELIHSYRQTYFSDKKRVYNPYFKYFFQDPLVSIIWWFQFFISALKATKQLGR